MRRPRNRVNPIWYVQGSAECLAYDQHNPQPLPPVIITSRELPTPTLQELWSSVGRHGPTLIGGGGGPVLNRNFINDVSALFERAAQFAQSHPCGTAIFLATATVAFDIAFLGTASAALGAAETGALLVREGASLGARGFWRVGGYGAMRAGQSKIAAGVAMDEELAQTMANRLTLQSGGALGGLMPSGGALDAFASVVPRLASVRGIFRAGEACDVW